MAKRKYEPRFVPEGMMSIADAASRLHISPAKVQKLTKKADEFGKLEKEIVGHKLLITAVSIEAYEARRRELVRAAIARTPLYNVENI